MVPELHSPLLLGYAWLHDANPRVDWRRGLITLPASAHAFVAATPPSPASQEESKVISGQQLEAKMQNPKVHRSLKMWVIERTPKGKPA